MIDKALLTVADKRVYIDALEKRIAELEAQPRAMKAQVARIPTQSDLTQMTAAFNIYGAQGLNVAAIKYNQQGNWIVLFEGSL